MDKLKIIQDKQHNLITLWKTNERDEWERHATYPTIPMFVADYYESVFAVHSEILDDIMQLVNEGYTFVDSFVEERDQSNE